MSGWDVPPDRVLQAALGDDREQTFMIIDSITATWTINPPQRVGSSVHARLLDELEKAVQDHLDSLEITGVFTLR